MSGLEALRAAYAERGDEDRPAVLLWNVDEDGMIHLGPLTVEDAIYLAEDLAASELSGSSPFMEME
jgi:hypothetical protein